MPAKSKVPPELVGTALEVFDEISVLVGFHDRFRLSKNGAFYTKEPRFPSFVAAQQIPAALGRIDALALVSLRESNRSAGQSGRTACAQREKRGRNAVARDLASLLFIRCEYPHRNRGGYFGPGQSATRPRIVPDNPLALPPSLEVDVAE